MLNVKNLKKIESSETSSDEELLPPLSVLKSYCENQSKVDTRISEIESHSKVQGNESLKLKSKRGEGLMFCCQKRWLGHTIMFWGVTRQRVTYDQLSLYTIYTGFHKKYFG